MRDTPKAFDLGDGKLLIVGKIPSVEDLDALRDIGNDELAIVVDVKELVGLVPSKEECEDAV